MQEYATNFISRFTAIAMKSVVFVDAGNSSNLYLTVNFARQYGIDISTLLANVIISRPFTVYQLVDLIVHQITKVIKRFNSFILIVSDLLHLFNGRQETNNRNQKFA